MVLEKTRRRAGASGLKVFILLEVVIWMGLILGVVSPAFSTSPDERLEPVGEAIVAADQAKPVSREDFWGVKENNQMLSSQARAKDIPVKSARQPTKKLQQAAPKKGSIDGAYPVIIALTLGVWVLWTALETRSKPL